MNQKRVESGVTVVYKFQTTQDHKYAYLLCVLYFKLQFLYCCLIGTLPLYSFLSGFISSVSNLGVTYFCLDTFIHFKMADLLLTSQY